MTVPVGLNPPLTVALSAIEVPTVAMAGCWLVLIVGVASLMITGSAGGAAGDRIVVAVAVVGGDPEVDPRRCRRVAGGGGHAAHERHVGVGEQRRAGGGRVVVEVERDRAGRVEPAADRGGVGDRAADGGAGRRLAGGDRRKGGLAIGRAVLERNVGNLAHIRECRRDREVEHFRGLLERLVGDATVSRAGGITRPDNAIVNPVEVRAVTVGKIAMAWRNTPESFDAVALAVEAAAGWRSESPPARRGVG